ncbi:lysophospholipase [Schizosaccharomyces japonicus yFS275]|uniref:Lysophospholipase NTE1 n=1 Tax=Schizosaccharomyces japonicus (strain yFS275 / FY16936) TaxID=402676 RepID=B6K5Y4_SCHJY|nr:lysophospholipase [Schizosaccharomyces japonicus yFS275]EEB08938.1 lysophospholipase [Schizosaccharomyces japonicus yFS275]
MEDTTISASNNLFALSIRLTARVITWGLVQLTRLSLDVLSFCTITLPKWTYKIVSLTLTVQLNFRSIVILFFIFLACVLVVIRYRYLNKYSRLPAESPIEEAKLDIDEGPTTANSKVNSIQTYLDEFLSAIRIFGYLEKPMFMELARYMETRRIAEGETIVLAKETSFILVVDGCFQVFVKNERGNQDDAFSDTDIEKNYSLLTEVHNGAPLSSLFTILELFTELVSDNDEPVQGKSESQASSPLTDTLKEKRESKAQRKLRSFYVVARAKVDTTIAVIPADAFRRLIKKYPKAGAHISQVILTRFERVTFSTGYYYLGLSDAIYKMELNSNLLTSYDLPNYIKPGLIDAFKTEARSGRCQEKSRGGYIVSKAAPSLSKTLYFSRGLQYKLNPDTSSPPYDSSTHSVSNAGDLFTSTNPHSAVSSSLNLRPNTNQRTFSHEIGDYDPHASLREGVLRCLLKLWGISDINAHPGEATSMAIKASAYTSDEGSMLGVNSHDVTLNFAEKRKPLSDYKASDAGTIDSVSSSKKSTNFNFSNDVEILFYKKGATLVSQREAVEGIFYVIDGFLEVNCRDVPDRISSSLSNEDSTRSFLIKPGGLANYQSCIANYCSFVTVKARTDALVGFFPRSALDKIVEREPLVSLTIAKQMLSFIPTILLKLDFAVEWVHLDPGEVICHQDEPSDCVYYVLSGRLRTVKKDEGKYVSEFLNEYSRGDSVGELEMLTNSRRLSSLFAIRDSEVAKLPKTLFITLASIRPSVGIQMSKIVASRMQDLLQEKNVSTFLSAPISKPKYNLRTLAILPATPNAPLLTFAQKLTAALLDLGTSVQLLQQSSVLGHLGKYAFNQIGRFKLSSYLADLEDKHDILIYVADTGVGTTWLDTCIRQADCIYVLAEASQKPIVSDFEKFLLSTKSTARKELVLLHRERFCMPGLTRTWLRERPWIHAHHHIQMELSINLEPEMTKDTEAKLFLNTIRTKVQNLHFEFRKYIDWKHVRPVYRTARSQNNDFARLARRICGKAIGLVLGGGGARGISQIGIIKVMEEYGIPIDIVGGTSIGAFNGGLYAREADIVPMFGRAKKFCGRMSNLWRFFLDLTYPQVAYTTGHEFNRGLWKTFGNSHIEDFWLPFYANTTNITQSRMDIHSSGYAWKYIRASMSLAGLVPPMLDDKGSMLLDGGYMDNLTVNHMRSLGVNVIFAVDVGSDDIRTPFKYGDTISGVWALINRWNPFGHHQALPTMAEIQSRLAYVTSVTVGEQVKSSPGCFYIRPPVTVYQTMEFGNFEVIYNTGYTFGKEYFGNLKKNHQLDEILKTTNQTTRHDNYLMTRRNSL